jgi:tRNA(fMet)-specific endonuclease VapC
MAGRLLIDTSAYAQFRRGQGEVMEMLAAADRLFVSAVSVGELEAGFVLGSRAEQNRGTLREFLSEPFVTVVNVDEAVARLYGGLFASLRRAGTPVPTNDIWIAACAMHVDAEVVTFDSDFDRFRDLGRRVLVP